ncbi:MAG TPA: M28 family peptidase [Pyrinomonadaceae bacterium]|nr:M28 family peptidase [Pyrinomonadaceae bacterium]
MRQTSVTRGVPRILLLAACGLFFFAALLEITQSAANPPAELQSATSSTPPVTSRPALVQRYQQTITPETLAARLYFLASDLFEGRETATRGQKLAAQYLASQYRLMGLAPKGTAQTTDPLSPAAYFQPFTVYRRTPSETRLKVLSGGREVASSVFSAEKTDDLSYFLTGSMAAATGGVVFAGYGIADSQLGYDDYAALAAKGISIDGKWVMVLADEPLGADGASLFPAAGGKPTKWAASLMPKRKAILAAGKPAGVLVVRYQGSQMQGTFADNAAQAALAARRVGPLSLYQSPFPPTYAISARLADQILAGGGRQVEGLREQINKSLKPVVFEAGGVTVEASAARQEGLTTENVLAFIEGSDPRLKDEVVVISSHYDHLGLNPALKGDQIFNGAADDGSGVAATLELAQAFMRAKRDGNGPRRSVLFINFSAEEKGTLGSAHYALHEPLVPLEKIAAEINMDGVGGIDAKHPAGSRNYIYIVGSDDLSRELIETNRRVKELTNVNLDLTEGRQFGSDHLYFQAQLVPFIYYSTGLTEHYHQPSDEAATIDYDHLARVTQLVFGTAWQVANQDARPQSVDRGRLVLEGYVCPPCSFECDTVVHARPGECPVCGMTLAPKYKQP